jgi:hypothetical protein
MNPYIQRMVDDMKIRNFSDRTIDSYTWHVDKFCQYYGKRLKKLPMVLSDQKAARLIECVENPKHRAVLLTCYAIRLRLAEATHLKVADIDGQRQQIRITEGKGRRDRIVPASPRLLQELRTYWKQSKPRDYLFPGRTPDVPLSSATIQKACKMAAAFAGIAKVISPHVLRHSFATGMLEAGVDVLTIGKLLGHSSFVTTMVYLHVRRQPTNAASMPVGARTAPPARSIGCRRGSARSGPSDASRRNPWKEISCRPSHLRQRRRRPRLQTPSRRARIRSRKTHSPHPRLRQATITNYPFRKTIETKTAASKAVEGKAVAT